MSASADVALAFGEAPDGRMVSIADVPSGRACEMVCPGCRAPLWAKKGTINAHHFAHEADGSCAGAYETMLHKLAKQIITDERRIYLPALNAQIDGQRQVIHPAQWLAFDRVGQEVWQDGIRPDVVGHKDERSLAVEVLVTHACGPEKIKLVQARGVAMIEIDLSDVARDIDLAGLTAAVLRNAPRRWLSPVKLTSVRHEQLWRASLHHPVPFLINFDKVSTSPFDAVIVGNVKVTSRYQQAHEFDLMGRVLLGLSKEMRNQIKEMFCDSQATRTYSVTMHKVYDAPAYARLIGDALNQLFMEESGGHNGIYIGALCFDSDWECDNDCEVAA